MEKINTHISLTSCAKIGLICQPIISKTPIKVFVYSRIYPDGSRLELSNHAAHLENAFVTRAKMKNIYTPSLIPENQRYLLINSWIENMKDGARTSLLEQLHSQHDLFNIGNEFCIKKNHPKYVEIFHFYANKDLTGLENFYLNNLSILEQFALYFLDKANALIKLASADRLVKPWRNQPAKITLNNLTNSFDNKIAKEDIKLTKFYIEVNGIETYLTKREIDCVLHLIKGKSNKEIASALFVSPRTIETHIESLRAKTLCSSRSDLIAFFIENDFLKFIPE